MHGPLDPIMAADRLHRRYVDPRRFEQLLGHRPTQLGHERLQREARAIEDDLPRQAVSIGMEARTGQTNHLIAHPDVPAVEDPPPLDHPETETRQVVFPRLVEI